MKILEFHASGVFDYLAFDLPFNSDITLLTGGNGSGKTTVIRLIQALLTASVRELNLIPFTEVHLLIDTNGEQRTISANYGEDVIFVSVSGIEEPLRVPRIDAEEIERRSVESPRSSDVFAEITVQISSAEVFKFLSSLEAPVILGLERRMQSSSSPSEREFFYSNTARYSRRRIFRGTLGLSLAETQNMVQDAYRQIRKYQDGQNETLRENMLLSLFNYTTADSVIQKPNEKAPSPSWLDQRQIMDRRREVEASLVNMFESPKKISKVIDIFFERLKSLFEQMKSQGTEGLSLEWLLNKAQIDRIMSIIKIVDEHKLQMDKFMTPFNQFLRTINGFYADSSKKIDVDPVGCLVVTRKDGRSTSVEALSSGERQILVILAHLMHNHYSGKSGVVIIDEPELSLHLKWQGMFVEEVAKLSPDTQFILATHSPEIVGDYRDKCLPVMEANQ